MLLLDRIEEALRTKRLSPQVFERCAQDLISTAYPGLSPIPGGTDWGRDADIHAADADPPLRLLVTTSRNLDGIRANMLRGVESMKAHGLPFDRLVLACPGQLSQLQRHSLDLSARKHGATIEAVYGTEFFASGLRRDGEWRSKLLGLSPEPIALSRLPRDLAESPWGSLPLVGRDDELKALCRDDRDCIVIGPPGVGKTRLLTAFPVCAFADTDAPLAQVADDIRWVEPPTVVVDDAGKHGQIVRGILRLRQSEPELRFRLVVACWPDEVEQLSACFPSQCEPGIVEVGLMERQHIDELLARMGVTWTSARAEILDQAEGRPGWAVMLADLLLRTRDAKSLFSGKALLGQVRRYLYRASLPPTAVDVLAAVSALGGVTAAELADLAAELGIGRAEVADALSKAAKGGLVDVMPVIDSDGYSARRYDVRPPMLAKALVAERAYGDVPGIRLQSLVAHWPDRLLPMAEATIDSALLGVAEARAEAEVLYTMAVDGSGMLSGRQEALRVKFACLDVEAGRLVLRDVKASLERWKERSSPLWETEPLVDAAYLIARRYRLEEAVEFLLEVSLLDPRATSAHPEHPIRKLTDLVQAFHPDFPVARGHRTLLSKAVDKWIEGGQSKAKWDVYGKTLQAVLSLRLESSYEDPGDPAKFVLLRTILPPEETRWISESIWPVVLQRLHHAPDIVVKGALDAIDDWLTIGRGFDRPFGGAHSDAAMRAAKESGEALLRDVAQLAVEHAGLSARLLKIAEFHHVSGCHVEMSDTDRTFFVELDHGEDWKTQIDGLRRSVERVVSPWASDDPLAALTRLRDIAVELGVADVQWPDRVVLACRSLAAVVADPMAWSDAAFQLGLFPQAAAFVEHAVAEGRAIGADRLTRYLSDDRARGVVLQLAIVMSQVDEDAGLAVSALTPADFHALEGMMFGKQLSAERTKEILRTASVGARGATAAAMMAAGGEKWSPGSLEAEWLEAIRLLDPATTPGLDDYHYKRLTRFLASHHPQVLVDWVRSLLERSPGDSSSYGLVPHGVWDEIHELPCQHRLGLFASLPTTPALQWMVGGHLVGGDTGWLSAAMDRGLISPEEAIHMVSGFGPRPPIHDLARLLVPLGVAPPRIAARLERGFWAGPESVHYGGLIEMFRGLAESGDPAVEAVGEAGVEMYTAARDKALAKERKKRIRGEL